MQIERHRIRLFCYPRQISARELTHFSESIKVLAPEFSFLQMTTNGIEDIYNFLRLSNTVATAGQPTEAQFSLIKAAGYQVVINLALRDSPNALAHEQAIVEALGMQYVQIPVIWEMPTLQDIAHFFTVMTRNAEQSVFVHCAANKRVSAFMYLYRRLQLGMSEEEAKRDLHQVWVPNEVWQVFMQQAIAHYSPAIPLNRPLA